MLAFIKVIGWVALMLFITNNGIVSRYLEMLGGDTMELVESGEGETEESEEEKKEKEGEQESDRWHYAESAVSVNALAGMFFDDHLIPWGNPYYEIVTPPPELG
ncbi:MAG: hypothetical protein JXQ90_06310 [Cyclobacteriaceae bacterium]